MSMFGPLLSVIEPYLREVFKHRLDVQAKRNHWKRSAIGKFMSLYESLFDLERASKAVLDAFEDLSHQGAVLVKTIVRDRLLRFEKCLKEFLDSYREVETLLSIYNDPLRINIVGIMTMKGTLWHDVEMWAEALPKLSYQDKRLTSIVSYLKVIPTRASIENLVKPITVPGHEFEDVRPIIAKLKAETISKIDVLRIDLADKDEVKAQLEDARRICKELRDVRAALASFIKESFPLDKIMAQE